MTIAARFHCTAVLVLLLAACAPGTPVRETSGETRPQSLPAATAPKAITVASTVLRSTLHSKLTSGVGSQARWYWLANAYLTGIDETETPVPMLADEVPSFERKTWTVNPDGTMETVYRIRPTAHWHDGQPVLARDFVFAWEAYLDPEFPVVSRNTERLIAAIDTPDERTLVVHWKEPYIRANAIGAGDLEPLPTHLLEQLYHTNKPAFIDGRQWSSEFVGAGPYKVEQWEPSAARLVLTAHDGFALGRPKIDRITIAIIEDENAVLAALLAGTVDVMFDSIATETALILRDQWEAQGRGTLATSAGSQRHLLFQLRDLPTAQPAVRDSRVRKALVMAIDRETMASSQPPGFTPAAYYMMSPSDRLYPTVDRTIPKHAYDPVAAARLLNDAGYRLGPEGLRRGPDGERSAVPFLTLQGPEEEFVGTVITENWRRIGVDGELSIVPGSRTNDLEFRSSFPGASMRSTSPNFSSDTVLAYTTGRIPHAANRWAGPNLGGYSSPAADRLAASILTTLEPNARDQLVLDLLRVWADDAAIVPFITKARFVAAARGIAGYDVNVSQVQGSNAWRIYNWTRE